MQLKLELRWYKDQPEQLEDLVSQENLVDVCGCIVVVE